MVVPADTPVTFRATSADVVHGFLIEDTNVNTMLVPGYVSALPIRFPATGEHLMPCHEFCGIGHEGMWAQGQGGRQGRVPQHDRGEAEAELC